MPRTHAKPRKQVVSAQHGYTVIYEGLLEGGYQVIVPALPGIVTYGRTIAEAREMAEDAIRCHQPTGEKQSGSFATYQAVRGFAAALQSCAGVNRQHTSTPKRSLHRK